MSKFKITGPFYFNGRRLADSTLTLERIGGRTCCGAYSAFKVEELDEPGRLFIDHEEGVILDVVETHFNGMIVRGPKPEYLCPCMKSDHYEENFRRYYGIKKVEELLKLTE